MGGTIEIDPTFMFSFDYELNEDFNIYEWSGSADNLEEVEVAVASNLGCGEADFGDSDFEGKIALVMRGNCTFVLKSTNAKAAGAVATIIYNDGADSSREGLVLGTLEGPGDHLPTVGISYEDGRTLKNGVESGVAAVSLDFDAVTDEGGRSKIIVATSRDGDPESPVVGTTFYDSYFG